MRYPGAKLLSISTRATLIMSSFLSLFVCSSTVQGNTSTAVRQRALQGQAFAALTPS